MLVFDDDQRLVAVLTHLGDQYGEVSGHWYLEASFGRLDGGSPRPSPTWTWYRRGLTNAWRLPDNRALPIKELEHLPPFWDQMLTSFRRIVFTCSRTARPVWSWSPRLRRPLS
jgi:hypothetical protein